MILKKTLSANCYAISTHPRTLGYILSPDKKRVLMVHRIARNDDEHLGKYNGLGGKLESNEDIATGMTREIEEEAGLTVNAMELRGTINWTGFGPNGEDWLGFIFIITDFEGTPPESNEEGNLAWHDIDSIMELPMWEGDRHFLPLFLTMTPDLFTVSCPTMEANHSVGVINAFR